MSFSTIWNEIYYEDVTEVLSWVSVDPTYCEKEKRAYKGNLTLQGSNRTTRRNRTLTRTPKFYSVIDFYIVCR